MKKLELLKIFNQLPPISKTGAGDGFNFVEYNTIKEEIFPILNEKGIIIQQNVSTDVVEGKHVITLHTVAYVNEEMEILSVNKSYTVNLQGLNTFQSQAAAISYMKRIALINDLNLKVKEMDVLVDKSPSDGLKSQIQSKLKPLSIGTKEWIAVNNDFCKGNISMDEIEKVFLVKDSVKEKLNYNLNNLK